VSVSARTNVLIVIGTFPSAIPIEGKIIVTRNTIDVAKEVEMFFIIFM
jgi:hypothetical protein